MSLGGKEQDERLADLASSSIICLFATLMITNRVKSEFVAPWMIVTFSCFYPLYLILAATISESRSFKINLPQSRPFLTILLGLYGHARALTKYSAWNPTART
jgi:hypothetical protein